VSLKQLSPKQIKALNESDAFCNIYEGAVRSGKSYVSLIRFLKHLNEGPDANYIVCGKSERTVMMNILDPLQKFTGGLVKYHKASGYFTLFNKKVYVVGANDERAEGKIRGPTFAGALVDEATLIPEGFFRMLLTRLTIPDSQIFCTTNPDSPFHWLKHEFIDVHADDTKFLKTFRFVIDDNPSLSQGKKDELRKSYQGLWYKRFIEGEWVLAEGAIFDFFKQNIHVVKDAPSYAKYWILGVDYGTTNPFSAILIGFNDDVHPTLWVEREFYWDSKQVGYQKTDAEYAFDIRKTFEGYPISTIYLDPAAASFDVELRRARLPVRQAKNDVLDGIRFVSSLFMNGDLVIKRDCVNLIKEIEGYVWDAKSHKDGVDRPIKVRDHAIDAMRYALFSHWGHKSSLRETADPKPINPMQYAGYGPQSNGWQRY
jgi:PBSX family phage terminase large subunit